MAPPVSATALQPAAAEALKTRDDFHVSDLRSIAVQGLVDAEHLPPIAEAKAVLHWHARHRFCPNCGAADASRAGRLAARLPGTARPSIFRAPIRSSSCWRSTATAACSAASPRFVPSMWSCLAGFIEPGESIEDAVRRETREEAGIACGRVAYFARSHGRSRAR